VYPLKAVLINCEGDQIPELRHELANQGVSVEGTFPDVKSLLADPATPQEEKRLYIMNVQSSGELQHMERLNEAFIGRPILCSDWWITFID